MPTVNVACSARLHTVDFYFFNSLAQWFSNFFADGTLKLFNIIAGTTFFSPPNMQVLYDAYTIVKSATLRTVQSV
jgi:hypothetical protein